MNRRKTAVFLINLALVVMELIATAQSFSSNHWGMFEYYTIDSNLLTLCSSILVLLYLICMPRSEEAPRAISYLRYLSVCGTTLTFLVVVCYLSPFYGGFAAFMISGNFIFHHTLCPILSFVSFVFLEKELRTDRRMRFEVLIPTILYATAVTALNYMNVIRGPYPFLLVHENPWWVSVAFAVGILGAAYLIALGVGALRKRANK